MKNNIRRNSANDLYNVYSGSVELLDYKNDYKFTEGINDIANFENCLWLFDIILDEQANLNSDVQIWHLGRVIQDSFTLICKNESGHRIAQVQNLQKDFYFDDITIIKKDNVFCLPNEQNNY
ncbi:DUF6876 family protein [Chryseobacterium paridis]|uniref:DUF6876 domain-containing protein n=1 Tax=Chryseobacterium paridis TaxID=2800328 RepID=A0ABS1FQG1_9FLAO|nr:DUF6876 family protein [Chryseobacterium paridis]MBK1894652.1 hypothetical protein [Chryseobacterium paridis]